MQTRPLTDEDNKQQECMNVLHTQLHYTVQSESETAGSQRVLHDVSILHCDHTKGKETFSLFPEKRHQSAIALPVQTTQSAKQTAFILPRVSK